MKIDKPKTSPEKYIGFGGNQDKKLSFKDQYDLPAKSQETPWVTSRFGPQDLVKAIANKRLNFNDLNFLPEGQAVQGYEMFPGQGRFSMKDDYDFSIGRPATPNFPEQQPDFDPAWNDSYLSSPIIPPEDKTKNPFPRKDNIDPNGYLLAMLANSGSTAIAPFPDLINENPQSSPSI
jgi:hypothetical protein